MRGGICSTVRLRSGVLAWVCRGQSAGVDFCSGVRVERTIEAEFVDSAASKVGLQRSGFFSFGKWRLGRSSWESFFSCIFWVGWDGIGWDEMCFSTHALGGLERR